MTTPLAEYYARRAAEYDEIYAKPERRADLAQLRNVVTRHFAGRRVLEVACGTGYWTELLTRSSASVVATDVSTGVLDFARAKPALAKVSFQQADAFDLAAVIGEFNAGFAGFWWSHVLRHDLSRFLRQFHDRVGAGASVMVIDNRFVNGSSTPVSRVDASGNSYQRRRLANGEEFEIPKNFPPPTEVSGCLQAAGAEAIDVGELEYYWYATYRVRNAF